MESDSEMVPFPLLLTPIESNYRACTIPYRFPSDNPRKATPTEIAWIDLFHNSIPSFKSVSLLFSLFLLRFVFMLFFMYFLPFFFIIFRLMGLRIYSFLSEFVFHSFDFDLSSCISVELFSFRDTYI